MKLRNPGTLAVVTSRPLVVLVGHLVANHFRHGWPYSLHHRIGVRPPPARVAVEDGGGAPAHPRVELEGGYQSNVFYTHPDDEGGVESSPLLRVGVGASIGNPNSGEVASRFQLTGDVQLTWNQYLSDTEEVTDQSDLGVQALLDAAFNPRGAVTFTLRDTFTRQVSPPPAEFADDVDRDKNTLSAILSV